MRRKIHVTDHGVQNAPEDNSAQPVATGDAATDALGETISSVEEHGDQVSDRNADSSPGRASGPDSSDLTARVAQLEKELEAERDKSLRTLAEFQNFRRRTEEENRRYAQFANEELIRTFLPVLDNFERALAAAEKNQGYEALMGGVALTHRQILELLKKNGVEPIETKGKVFDPNYHEAVERVMDSEEPENTVVQELQRGYLMNARVLRPSLVKVAGG